MLTLTSWIFTFVSLFGAYLNSKQDVRGFYLWLFSNGYNSLLFLYMGQLPQAFLFFAYWLITLNGVRSWKSVSSTCD